jgi:hypothetical protein
MVKAVTDPESAFERLVEAFWKLREDARQRMSEEEFRETDRRVNELAKKIRSRRRRKMRP